MSIYTEKVKVIERFICPQNAHSMPIAEVKQK